MLMSASRHEHVEHVLRPALADGNIILCDRYNDSTRIYQGVVGGVPHDAIEALNRLACGDLEPDLTILLDMDVTTGLQRADHRDTTENRFESKGMAFHQRVRSGFLDLAAGAPTRFAVIDAERDADTIHKDIANLVEARLKAAQVLT
jgi:dTMP kinase